MRDMEKKGTLEAAAGETLGQTLTVAQLDVCSDESVARCLRCIPGGEVDVLVNNAGVGLVGPVEGLSLPAMQNIFDTNFFGAVRLVKAVLPGMKRRRQGHIVVVSSVMGLQGVVFNEVYAASKFALEGFFESLAVQLLQFNIFITLVEPGPVATGFEGKLLEQVATAEFPGTDPDTLHYFRDFYLPASSELFRSVGQSPQDVAQSSGFRPTGHCQGHRLSQTAPAPTDKCSLYSTDCPQSHEPLGQPVRENHPPPALPLASSSPPWTSMPGLWAGMAPVSRASPNPPLDSQASSVHSRLGGQCRLSMHSFMQ
nr:retinol dehydrogenase 8 isoform X3 [Manis javanica]